MDDKTLLIFWVFFVWCGVFFCFLVVGGVFLLWVWVGLFFSVERCMCACEKERGSTEASLKNLEKKQKVEHLPNKL